jgi:hypothetical protein
MSVNESYKKSGLDILSQHVNNLRSLTLQTLDYATGYRLQLYAPFVSFPRHKLVFLAVPRSGSTSMEYMLTPLLGNGLDFGSPRFQHTFRHYMRSCSPREVVTRYNHFFKWAFVRNPWTRLYSCYLTRVRRRPNRYFRYHGLDKCKTFADFVLRICDIPDRRADSHFISQAYLLTYKDRFLPDQVCRFETYREDCRRIRKIVEDKTGIRLLELPHYYKTASEDYREAYSPRLVELVGVRYREDCRLFGYTYPG